MGIQTTRIHWLLRRLDTEVEGGFLYFVKFFKGRNYGSSWATDRWRARSFGSAIKARKAKKKVVEIANGRYEISLVKVRTRILLKKRR